MRDSAPVVVVAAANRGEEEPVEKRGREVIRLQTDVEAVDGVCARAWGGGVVHEGVHATVERRDDVGGEGANRGEIGEVQRGTGRGPAGGRETHGVGVRPRGGGRGRGPGGLEKGVGVEVGVVGTTSHDDGGARAREEAGRLEADAVAPARHDDVRAGESAGRVETHRRAGGPLEERGEEAEERVGEEADPEEDTAPLLARLVERLLLLRLRHRPLRVAREDLVRAKLGALRRGGGFAASAMLEAGTIASHRVVAVVMESPARRGRTCGEGSAASATG